MGLSHTTILTNFRLYINIYLYKKPKKKFTKKIHPLKVGMDQAFKQIAVDGRFCCDALS